MKRDMDLAREILFKIEDWPEYGFPIDIRIEGHHADEISYHVMLLNQAGLITAFEFSTDAANDWRASGLTWEGHEFLDAARENTRWNRAKEIVKSKGAGAMFEMLKAVLIDLAKAQLI